MQARAASVGLVMALWRYPVKSMQGEEINMISGRILSRTSGSGGGL